MEAGGSFGRAAGTLSAGVGAAGLVSYVFFALASHNLEPAEYGEIVVLWSAVFVTISVLYRPVEQFISREVASRRARREPALAPLRSAAALQGATALGFVVVALALRGPLEDDLFSGNETLYWIFVAAVFCFALSFFARGYLAGDGRFGVLAALLMAESSARCAFALAVAVGIASGQSAVALGVVAAPCLSLIVVPVVLRRGAMSSPSRIPVAAEDRRATLAGGAGFAAAVFVVMLSEQALLNTGPLLLQAFEGAAAAGFIFNVLMVARAPLVVFQGIAISLLPHLTRLRAGAEASFDGSVAVTLRAVAAFTVLVATVVALAGPELMQIAFGDKFEYDRAGLLIVTGGMGFYLGATTLNQAALAQAQARRAAACWAVCGIAFLAWALVPVLDPARRIEVGFAIAALALFVLLARVYRTPHPRSQDQVRPGSAEEIEARLALADEAG